MTKPPGEAADEQANQPPSDGEDGGEGTGVRNTRTPDLPAIPAQAVPSPEGFWAKNAVALGGIAATVITACVVSFFGYQTSLETQAAERQQSSIEFQRSERKAAYSDFLAKALALEDVENKVDTTRYTRPLQLDQQALDELRDSQDELNKWQAAADQLIVAAAAVDLVGSGNVRLRALDLRDAHNEVSNAYFDINVEHMRNPSDRQALDAAIETFESKRKDAVQARFDFSQAASESIGISLLGP